VLRAARRLRAEPHVRAVIAWIRQTAVLQAARVVVGPASIARYLRLEREASGARQADGRVAVRVRALGGKPVWLRPGTSDVTVLRETFLGRYHLPPPELQAGQVRRILDLGANIGLTVAHYAVLYPQARILGVELDAGNARLAQRNVRAWADRAEVRHAAVWPAEGTVAYRLVPGEEYGARVDPQADVSRPACASAPALSLSRLVDEHRAGHLVDFVKIDVEGAEVDILLPGPWADHVRALKVEVHAPFTVEACVRALERCGFAARRDRRHPFGVVAVRAPSRA
jgi:FkbM family methyltransferase